MSHQKKIMCVFNESIMVKMKFEVTMGVCREKSPCGVSLFKVEYLLNVQACSKSLHT